MAIYGPTRSGGALTGGPNGSSMAAPTGSIATAVGDGMQQSYRQPA